MTPEELRSYVGQVLSLNFTVRDASGCRVATVTGRLTVVDGPFHDANSSRHSYMITMENTNTWFISEDTSIEVVTGYPQGRMAS